MRELAARSDVVLENYKVGQLKKYGLDYESLRAVKPDLIYCSVTGFGQNGPYAHRAGYDFIIQGMGGFMSLTGERDDLPGGGPQKGGVAIADLMTGMYASIAVLAALNHKERTGEGQYIDMALLDVQVAMLANMNMNYLTTGQSPKRWGNAHANIVPYQTFATADMVKQKTKQEWIAALEAAGVPCGPINQLHEVFADPQVQARDMQIRLPHPTAGHVDLVGSPMRLSATPVRYASAPPLLGQHTDDLLGGLLGLPADQIAGLRAKKIIA